MGPGQAWAACLFLWATRAVTPDFLRRAIDLARDNVRRKKGGPFGAVVVCDGEVISEGVNLVTSVKDPTAHAEIIAIREACRKLGHFELTDCDIYSSCEPCPMCLGAIYWSRLNALYFAATRDDAAAAGFDDSFLYQELPRAWANRRVKTYCGLREEGREPFALWLATPDRVPY